MHTIGFRLIQTAFPEYGQRLFLQHSRIELLVELSLNALDYASLWIARSDVLA